MSLPNKITAVAIESIKIIKNDNEENENQSFLQMRKKVIKNVAIYFHVEYYGHFVGWSGIYLN